jgi:hypothetical protein
MADGRRFEFSAQLTIGNDEVANRALVARDRQHWQAMKMDERFATTEVEPKTPAIYRRIKDWLKNCRDTHDRCRDLTWSDSRPSRFVKIIDEDSLQLVEGIDSNQYVALSYCWGDKNELSAAEWDLIVSGQTKSQTAGEANLERRLKGFHTDELPKTLQDAIRLVSCLGIEYLWVS